MYKEYDTYYTYRTDEMRSITILINDVRITSTILTMLSERTVSITHTIIITRIDVLCKRNKASTRLREDLRPECHKP
jgi:hypothetical protein